MNRAFPQETQCAWCIEEQIGLTRDHVVPRSIGWTLEFALPACKRCQGILSKAERTLARNSILAIHALASQLPPRHPSRPVSGVLQVHYLLVKNPLGGYGQSALHSCGKMESLAHCESKSSPVSRLKAGHAERAGRRLTPCLQSSGAPFRKHPDLTVWYAR